MPAISSVPIADDAPSPILSSDSKRQRARPTTYFNPPPIPRHLEVPPPGWVSSDYHLIICTPDGHGDLHRKEDNSERQVYRYQANFRDADSGMASIFSGFVSDPFKLDQRLVGFWDRLMIGGREWEFVLSKELDSGTEEEGSREAKARVRSTLEIWNDAGLITRPSTLVDHTLEVMQRGKYIACDHSQPNINTLGGISTQTTRHPYPFVTLILLILLVWSRTAFDRTQHCWWLLFRS